MKRVKVNRKRRKKSKTIFPAKTKELLTTDEAALFIERTVVAVRIMRDHDILVPIKLKGRCYYRKSDLIHWIILGRPYAVKGTKKTAKVIPMFPLPTIIQQGAA
jgi:hypothetical protein